MIILSSPMACVIDASCELSQLLCMWNKIALAKNSSQGSQKGRFARVRTTTGSNEETKPAGLQGTWQLSEGEWGGRLLGEPGDSWTLLSSHNTIKKNILQINSNIHKNLGKKP